MTRNRLGKVRSLIGPSRPRACGSRHGTSERPITCHACGLRSAAGLRPTYCPWTPVGSRWQELTTDPSRPSGAPRVAAPKAKSAEQGVCAYSAWGGSSQEPPPGQDSHEAAGVAGPGCAELAMAASPGTALRHRLEVPAFEPLSPDCELVGASCSAPVALIETRMCAIFLL